MNLAVILPAQGPALKGSTHRAVCVAEGLGVTRLALPLGLSQ